MEDLVERVTYVLLIELTQPGLALRPQAELPLMAADAGTVSRPADRDRRICEGCCGTSAPE